MNLFISLFEVFIQYAILKVQTKQTMTDQFLVVRVDLISFVFSDFQPFHVLKLHDDQRRVWILCEEFKISDTQKIIVKLFIDNSY